MTYVRPKMDTSPFKCGRGGLVMPLPHSDSELAILSEAYFGIPLRMKAIWRYGDTAQYEVEQDYNAYHGTGFKYGKYCLTGYDHSRVFWRTVFGPLYCGGIARASYGQARITGHRNVERIDRWISDRRLTQGSPPRAAFVRLARRHGVGENIVGRVDRRSDDVLMSGRVDGALAASMREASP